MCEKHEWNCKFSWWSIQATNGAGRVIGSCLAVVGPNWHHINAVCHSLEVVLSGTRRLCRTSLQKHSRRPQTSPQIETLLVTVLLYHPLIENTETPQTSAAPSSVSTNSRIASMVHTWRYLWESSAWGPETRCGQLSIATVWIGQYWLIDKCEPSDLPKITCETGISYVFVLFRDQPTKEDNWKNSYQ